MIFKNGLLITENLEIGKEPFINALEFLYLNTVGAALEDLKYSRDFLVKLPNFMHSKTVTVVDRFAFGFGAFQPRGT